MERTARVARTAHDLDHVNRLRFPYFGILTFYLKAAGKTSKAYLPAGLPPPTTPDSGSDNFNFAPEKDILEIHYEIEDKYAVADGGKLELFTRFDETPLWSLDIAILGKDWVADGKHVIKWDGRVVKPTTEQAGTEKPDGSIEHDLTALAADKTVQADFPDGYVTLQHPPYKLRLSITTNADPELKKRPRVAWTYFQILIKKIELELGPEEAVPASTVDDDRHKQDKAVRQKIEDDGGLPASGATRKVYLISNLYKTDSGQMNDNTAFTVYKDLWEDGPNIPIVAKIRILDASGTEVKLDEAAKGAVALGKAKFLWDWEDEAEDVDAKQGQAKPKAFIKKAIDFYKDGTDTRSAAKNHTYPKGDNCHIDRGGKRGPDAKPVFPDQAGYDPKDPLDAGKCPFKVVAGSGSGPKKRKWASYSLGWTSGTLKGKTGVIFQPARTAGDQYKITVYLAYDKTDKDKPTLDAIDEPLPAPDAIKTTSGTFQIWRELHLARYIRKKGSIAAFLPGNLGGVQAIYDEAYVHVENKMQAGDQYLWSEHRAANNSTPDYNAACRDKITAAGDAALSLAVDSTADHSSVDSAFMVRDYETFVKKKHEDLNAGTPAAANDFDTWNTPQVEGLGTTAVGGWPADDRHDRLKTTRTWLRTNALKTKEIYAKPFLDNKLMLCVKAMMKDRLVLISGKKTGAATAGAKDGITIIHFNYTNTYLRDLRVAGVGSGSKLGSAVSVDDADRNKCVFLYLQPRLDTFVHEIGHHLFLPHAPWKQNDAPMAGQPNRHDDTDKNCMMSYNRPRPAFCGLCQLRLRGWSADTLNKTAADNKKP